MCRLAQAEDGKRFRLRSVDERRRAAVKRQSDSFEELRAGRIDELGAEALAAADTSLLACDIEAPRAARRRARHGVCRQLRRRPAQGDRQVGVRERGDSIVMTIADFLAHPLSAYGVDGNKRDARQLLDYLLYEYGEIKNGYYFAKANNHRRRLLPFLSFCLSTKDLIVVASQDEKPFRMFT